MKKPPSLSSPAFSLIEVTLALGVISFALVGVLGLIPLGMAAFRKAVDVSVGSQIVQQVVADVQQTDFADLTQSGTLRYFDDQGVEQTGQGLYQVNVVVDTSAAVPGASAPAVAGGNLARLIIEIVKNPANRALTRGSDGSIQDDPTHGVTVARYPAFVARSQ